jgi:hypothetical protein
MTLSTIMYGIVPLIVDFTETHVFHPGWTGHARFHMVWLLGVLSFNAILAGYFIWIYKHDPVFGIRMGGLLGLGSLFAFFASAATMSIYGGSLHDPGGVVSVMGFDGNLLGFAVALVLLALGWFIANKKAALAW